MGTSEERLDVDRVSRIPRRPDGFRPVPRATRGAAAATRTFARLCASLTEEAEAIGWYEQRLAVETDPDAVAVMRDALGEEYKHFSMDLEFLLRRTPRGGRSPKASCSSPATSSSTARRPRPGAASGGRRRAPARTEDRRRRRVARDRQPRGEAGDYETICCARSRRSATPAGSCSTTRRASA